MTANTDIFVCPDCGPQDRMEFDASRLMERAFEGVMFDIVLMEDGVAVLGKPEDADYLESFNMPLHCETARKMVLAGELDAVYCPKCHDSMA
jgi:Zn finger protein HypA/HybF involved in hydrogenase expression